MFSTISNWISISRVFIAIPLGFYVWTGDKFLIIIFTVIGLFTDFLDGYLARKLGQESEWGKILDPLADKIIIGIPALVLIIRGDIPYWLGAMIISRDVLIFIGGIYARKKLGYVIASNWLGKITVNVISVCVLMLIFELEFLYETFFILTPIFIVASFLSYLIGMLEKIKQVSN